MKFNHISPTLRYSIHKSWNRRTLVLKMSLKGISRCRSFSNIKTPYPWHDLSSLAVTPPTSISSTPFFPPSSPVLLCLCHLCFLSLSLSLSLTHTHTFSLSLFLSTSSPPSTPKPTISPLAHDLRRSPSPIDLSPHFTFHSARFICRYILRLRGLTVISDPVAIRSKFTSRAIDERDNTMRRDMPFDSIELSNIDPPSDSRFSLFPLFYSSTSCVICKFVYITNGLKNRIHRDTGEINFLQARLSPFTCSKARRSAECFQESTPSSDRVNASRATPTNTPIFN